MKITLSLRIYTFIIVLLTLISNAGAASLSPEEALMRVMTQRGPERIIGNCELLVSFPAEDVLEAEVGQWIANKSYIKSSTNPTLNCR